MDKKAKPAPNGLKKYIRALKRLGFRQVLKISFAMPCDESDRDEKFFAFFHPRDAVLLTFDTYLKFQNDGNVYCNWKPHVFEGEIHTRSPFSGGHWSSRGKRDVFVGHHFLPRHNLRTMLDQLRRSGTFVSPWVEGQRICLTHYGDPYNEQEKITAERIKMLPKRVRDAILL